MTVLFRSTRRRAILLIVLSAQLATVVALVVMPGRLSAQARSEHAHLLFENAAQEAAVRLESHLEPAEWIVSFVSELEIGSASTADVFGDAFVDALEVSPQLAGVFVGTPDGGFHYASRFEDGYRVKTISIDRDVRTTDLVFMDADGQVIERTRDPDDDYDPTARPWYGQALASPDEIVWTDPYVFFTSRHLGVTAATSIVRDGEVLGVVGADIELGQLSEFLASLHVGTSSRAVITNQAGTVIAHRNKSQLQVSENDGGYRTINISELDDPLARAAVASLPLAGNGDEDTTVRISGSEGEGGLTSYRSVAVGEDRWVVSIYGAPGSLMAALEDAGRTERRLTALGGAIAMGILGLVAFRITRPIRRLEEQHVEDEVMLSRVGRVLESSQNEIFMFDAETMVFSLVNAGARDNLGYSMEELSTMTPLAIKPEPAHEESDTGALADADGFMSMVELLRSGQIAVSQFETVHRRSDGSTYPVEVNLQYFAAESPPVFVEIVSDITERKAAEANLVFQKALLVSQNEARPDGVVAVDPNGRWLNSNQRFKEMWRFPEGIEAEQRPGVAMAHISDRLLDPGPLVDMIKSLTTSPNTSAEIEVDLKDGRTFAILGRPIRGEGEQTYGRVWQHRDVTDERSNEAELHRHRHRLEELVTQRTADLREANGQLEQEASERRLLEIELKRQAYHDRLTGLPNRHSLERDFLAVVDQLSTDRRLALIFMDLNGFKYVNDTLGHTAGDKLLVQASERLRRIVRSSDMLVRLGGDEFAVLVRDASDHACRRVLDRIRDCFIEPYDLDGHPFHVTASIGVAFSTSDEAETNFEDIVRRADLAMYRAKRQGTGVSFYDAEADKRVQEWAWIERHLRDAIDRDQLELHYQPILDLTSGRPISAEALLRWRHPDRGLIMPDQFIPLAQETGLLTAIDHWVVGAVIDHAAGVDHAVSVNVAPRTLLAAGFVDHVETRLRSAGLAPERLHIEVTEQALAQPVTTKPILDALVALGVKIAVDDFGTGYSSLSYLRQYPLSSLKLDRSFIVELGLCERTDAVAETVIHLAHSLNLTVVAEGVETDDQDAWLRRNGCDAAQGYLYARPALPTPAVADDDSVPARLTAV